MVVVLVFLSAFGGFGALAAPPPFVCASAARLNVKAEINMNKTSIIGGFVCFFILDLLC
jgi:hypothetical protein